MNVDESFDASENFLNTNVEAFDRPKKYYFAYFPLDKYPGKFPQQKINDVTDRYFDQYNSFAGVSRGKLPSDPLQQIIKVSFVDITDRDKFCTVEIPNLEKCTFLPLEVKPIQPYVPDRSIMVTEIPLDATEQRVRKIFSAFGNIVRFTMETRNLWQRATITFDDKAKFEELKNGYGQFLLHDMVRFHICTLPRKEIQDRSKFSAKLTNLPRNTTARHLLDIGRMIDATAWVVPKARSNYQNLQHAYFYFRNNDDVKAAIAHNNLTLDSKRLEWTTPDKKLCAICSSAHHNASNCPKRRQAPKDRSMQYLYQRFQPAQFSNYTAPKKPIRNAIKDNISFAEATNPKTSRPNPPPKKQTPNRNNTTPLKSSIKPVPKPWADDIPPNMDDNLFDQTVCPTPGISNGTAKGGSMHDNDLSLREFIREQFNDLHEQLIYINSELDFSVKRIAVIEKALNISVFTPVQAKLHNDNLPADEDWDQREAHIDTSKSTIVFQKDTNKSLIEVCQQQQQRITTLTETINTLVNTCATFQSALLKNNLISVHDTHTFLPLNSAPDQQVLGNLNNLQF
jgi:hypothetical protein